MELVGAKMKIIPMTLSQRFSATTRWVPLALAFCACVTHAQTYSVTDLGVATRPAFGPVYASAINASGELVGTLGDLSQPFTYSYEVGNIILLPVAHGDGEANISGVNAAGTIVGDSCPIAYGAPCHGVRWTNGIPEVLSPADFFPGAINDAGDMAGSSGIGGRDIYASVLRHGVLTHLAPLPGIPADAYTQGEAIATNDAGMFAGSIDVIDGNSDTNHAVFWKDDSHIEDLGPNTTAYGMNSQGQVVGTADYQSAALWTDGKITYLKNGYTYSGAVAINDAGTTIVGYGYGASDPGRALIWINEIVYDLNDLIDPAVAKTVQLLGAQSINDAGQISVIGTDVGTQNNHSYLLSPSGMPRITAEPEFDVIPRSYASAQSITLSDATAGSKIYFTIDGTTPTAQSSPYTNPIMIGRTTTLRAIAAAPGYNTSALAAATYTIAEPKMSVLPVSLATVANVPAIGTPGFAVSSGLDRIGDELSSDLLGDELVWSGVPFYFLPPMTLDAVAHSTIPLPAGNFSSIKLLATAARGDHPDEPFTVTYTDGTTSTLRQGVSDWANPLDHPGESRALQMAYRVEQLGRASYGPYYVYGYSVPLTPGKVAKTLTLPAAKYLLVLAMTMTGD